MNIFHTFKSFVAQKDDRATSLYQFYFTGKEIHDHVTEVEHCRQEHYRLKHALVTLGFTDENAIQWLSEGIRPGTIGWTMKTLDLWKENKEELKGELT